MAHADHKTIHHYFGQSNVYFEFDALAVILNPANSHQSGSQFEQMYTT
jgi:hypothetical protein